MRIWTTRFGSVPHYGQWGTTVRRKRRFFLLKCINNQYLPNTGNTLLSSSSTAHSHPARRFLPRRCRAEYWPVGVRARQWRRHGSLLPSRSFFCVRACRLGFRMRWDLSVSFSQTSLLTHSAVPVLPTLNTLKYSASKHKLSWRYSICPFLQRFIDQQVRIIRVFY